MEFAYEACKLLSIASFLVYGLLCLGTRRMVAEFERYGLPRLRVLTGALEVLGALGLIAGYAFEDLVPFAAGGLALMMLPALGVRIRIRDPLVAMLPALVLLLANAFVLAYSAELLAPRS